MENPKLYIQGSNKSHRDAREMISKYMNVDHWKGYGENVLDIGCGAGDCTWDILRDKIPSETKIFGADIGENMIKYASEAFPDIEFFHLDIGTKTIPNNLIGAFNHVYSNYCLHWIRDQRQVMENIYNLLKPGGDFFTSHLLYHPCYVPMYNVATREKWKKYITNPKVFAHFRYDYLQSAEDQMREILSDVGFEVSVCKAMSRKFIYPSVEALKITLTAVNPYSAKIPNHMKEEFFEETLQEMMMALDLDVQKIKEDIVINYDLIVISAIKMNPS